MSRNSPAPDSLPQPFSSTHNQHHFSHEHLFLQPHMGPLAPNSNHSHMPQPSPPRLPGSTFLWGQPPQQHDSQHSHTNPPADPPRLRPPPPPQYGHPPPGSQPEGFASLFPPGVKGMPQALPELLDGQHPMDFEQLLGDPTVQQLLQAQPGVPFSGPWPGSQGWDPNSLPALVASLLPAPSGQHENPGTHPAPLQHTPVGSQEGSHRAESTQGSKQSPQGRPRSGASPPPGFAAPAVPAGPPQQQRSQQLLGQQHPPSALPPHTAHPSGPHQQQQYSMQPPTASPHTAAPPSSQQQQRQQQQEHGGFQVPQDAQAQSALLLQALQASPDLLLSLLPGGQNPAAASQLRGLILENICKNPSAWGLAEDTQDSLPEPQQHASSNRGAENAAARVPPAHAGSLGSEQRGLSGQGFGSGFPAGPVPEPERSDRSLYEMLYGEQGGGCPSLVGPVPCDGTSPAA